MKSPCCPDRRSPLFGHFIYSLFCHFLAFCLVISIPLRSGEIGAELAKGVSVYLNQEEPAVHLRNPVRTGETERKAGHKLAGRIPGDAGGFRENEALTTNAEEAAPPAQGERDLMGGDPFILEETPRSVIAVKADKKDLTPEEKSPVRSVDETKDFRVAKAEIKEPIPLPTEKIPATDAMKSVQSPAPALSLQEQSPVPPDAAELKGPASGLAEEKPLQNGPSADSSPEMPVSAPPLIAQVKNAPDTGEHPVTPQKKEDGQAMARSNAPIETALPKEGGQRFGKKQRKSAKYSLAASGMSSSNTVQASQGESAGAGGDEKSHGDQGSNAGGKTGHTGVMAAGPGGGGSPVGDAGNGYRGSPAGEGASGSGAASASGSSDKGPPGGAAGVNAGSSGQGEVPGSKHLGPASSAADTMRQGTDRPGLGMPAPEVLIRKDIRIVVVLQGSGMHDIIARVTRKPYPVPYQKTVVKKEEEVKLKVATEMSGPGMQGITHTLSAVSAEKGVYSFIIENRGNEDEADISFLLYEGQKKERKKEYKKIPLKAGTVLRYRFVLPDALFWDDTFSFVIEDSQYMTKVQNESGLIWREEKERVKP